MTTYTWSALADGTFLAFNPSTDALNFDDSAISAAAVGLNAASTTQSIFAFGGKTVTLQNAPTSLTATNVSFSNGSRLLVGDGTTNNSNDAGNNVITGGAGSDRLYGLGGDDTLRGRGGADVLDGGAGFDTAFFSGKLADYTLAGSLAAGGRMTVTQISGADGTDKLTGIERLQFSDATVDLGFSAADEFKIKGTITDQQYQPLVTKLVGGGFVLIWQSDLEDGSGWGIHGQRYSPGGLPEGAEFNVNAAFPSEQYQPSVTALSDGGFVVTWASDGQDGSGLGVYAHRYDGSGASAGLEFRVNTTVANDQYGPAVTAMLDGGFVVTWESYLQDGSGWGVYGQRYDAAVARVGTEFKVNTTVTGDQYHPLVSALADGGFEVTWQSLNGFGGGISVHGQRYEANGAGVGSELKLDTFASHSVSSPSITPLSGGAFVTTWQSYRQHGSGRDIFGERFDAAGTAVGGVFKVNTTAADSDEQPWQCVTPLADGSFVVTWCGTSQAGAGLGIYGQRFSASGAVAGTEFLINSDPAASQEQPLVTALADGGFAVTWMTSMQGNSGTEIVGERFHPLGDPIGEVSLTVTGDASSQVLKSLGGNDTLIGGGGDDTLDGGDGFDTAVFSAPVANYHFGEHGTAVAVTGPDGVDTLSHIEQLSFANLSFSIADLSHFDPLYYLNQNPDVAAAGGDPLAHYLSNGWSEGRDPNPTTHLAAVDGLEYIASYSDLMGAFGANKAAGYQHFATAGVFEGRTVSFDGLEYIASYGDLISAFGANADAGATHYIQSGRFEGRATGFDGVEYIASYSDLINAFHNQVAATADPDIGANHYIVAGYGEHRATHLFDAAQYLANYADLQAAFGSDTEAATLHYITAGYFEGRTDHPLG